MASLSSVAGFRLACPFKPVDEADSGSVKNQRAIPVKNGDNRSNLVAVVPAFERRQGDFLQRAARTSPPCLPLRASASGLRSDFPHARPNPQYWRVNMTQIRSTWTLSTPPPLTGLLTAAEWSAAATMAIPRGTLLAQNDSTHLYIGLDLTAETGTANPNDYFYFYVDINNNGVIDPHRDVTFGQLPGNQNRLYMFSLLGPNTYEGVNPSQVIPSLMHSGFGPSLHEAANHRQWQIAFALSDMGIDPIDPAGPSPVVDFGLTIGTVGGTTAALPPNAAADFSDLNSIVLSCAPGFAQSGVVGPVIAAVGLIGVGDIASDGYCTIVPTYFINPDHASFCGTLNLIGNVATLTYLYAHGARKYTVSHRYGATETLAAAAPARRTISS